MPMVVAEFEDRSLPPRLAPAEEEIVRALSNEVRFPFREPPVLRAMFRVAEQVYQRAEAYDLVIGEGDSAILSTEVMAGVVNEARAGHDLPPAQLRNIDGGVWAMRHPSDDLILPFDGQSRTLLVAEYINSGVSIHQVFETTVNGGRPPEYIDIAAVGMMQAQPPAWMAREGATLLRVMGTLDMESYLTRTSDKVDVATIHDDTQRVVATFLEMLREAPYEEA